MGSHALKRKKILVIGLKIGVVYNFTVERNETFITTQTENAQKL